MRAHRSRLWFLAALAAWTSTPEAGLYLTKEEALFRAFADTSEVRRKTAILTGEQVEAIETRAHAALPSRIVSYYAGRARSEGDASEDGAEGAPSHRWIFFEAETVRTLEGLLMVSVDGEGRLESVEFLAFNEPEEYLPSGRWMGLFQGRSLDRPWRLGRDIPVISGSTLSVRAVDRVVRRVLATWEVLKMRPEESP